MFNITLKRPLVTLAVTAGLLVASAGPASASPSEPLITPPQPNTIMADFLLIDESYALSNSMITEY